MLERKFCVTKYRKTFQRNWDQENFGIWKNYNEKKYEHISKVREALLSEEQTVIKGNLGKVKKMIDEGKTIIEKRQKLIKLANREDDVWEVEKCYKSDTRLTLRTKSE